MGVLDMLHISSNHSGIQDLLGSELNRIERKRAHPMGSSQMTDGEMVAWRETSSHSLKHGKLLRQLPDGTVLVQVSQGQERPLLSNQVSL